MSRRKICIMGVILLAVVVTLGICFFVIFRKNTSPPSYPPALVQSADAFNVLYYKGALPLGFTIDEAEIRYTNGVLFIPVIAEDGRKVIITQQPTPRTFAQSNDVAGDEKITGADGKAAISHVQGHATATMLSKDRKTMVIINDISNIGTESVKDLMRGLRPIQP